MIRWALRLLRREWRQHTLVIVLLTVAVAAALFATTAAYNVGSDPTAEFGNATHRIMVDQGDPAESQTLVAEASSFFAGSEVVGEALAADTRQRGGAHGSLAGSRRATRRADARAR